jgi:hypothetical protein
MLRLLLVMRQMMRHSRLQQLQGHLPRAWRVAQQQWQLLALLITWRQT